MNIDKSVSYLDDNKYKRITIHVVAYKGPRGMLLGNLLKYMLDAWGSEDENCQNILYIPVMQNQKPVIKFICQMILKLSFLCEGIMMKIRLFA